MAWTAVTFHTGGIYERAALALAQTCTRQRVPLRIMAVPQGGRTKRHHDMMRYKIDAIRDAFAEGATGALWLDADALIRDGMDVRHSCEWFDAIRLDAAWHWFRHFNDRVSQSMYRGLSHWPGGGTLWFGNTSGGNALLDAWANEFEDNPGNSRTDQLLLYDAYLKTPDIYHYALPLSWLAMVHDPHVERDKIVIEHMQVRHSAKYLDAPCGSD